MAIPYFYYGTTQKMLAIFASVFDNIYINKKLGNGLMKLYKVPVHYSQKDKLLALTKEYPNIDDGTSFSMNAPTIAYELMDMQYDPARATPQLNKYMNTYNKVPYNLIFNLYISAERQDDVLQIVEQIIPSFTPYINIQIGKPTDTFGQINMPLILNSVGGMVEYEGTASDDRTIMYSLSFTLKTWYFRSLINTPVVKNVIIHYEDAFENPIVTDNLEVIPNSATINDDYEIINYQE